MPILDKLNKKLDEAGVEERGRTIEEAVDLLPAMGGSGGLQFEQIGTTHEGKWFENKNGYIKTTYYRLGGENSNLFAIKIDAAGAQHDLTKSGATVDAHSNVVAYDPSVEFRFVVYDNSSKVPMMVSSAMDSLYAAHIPSSSSDSSTTATYGFKAFAIVIGKLADNIT